MIATCPNSRCGAPIAEDHPYSWCTACGDPLPDFIQRRLPRLQEARRKAAAARAALGTEPQVEEICARCGARYTTSAKLDSQGFRESNCPNCHFPAVHPLKWPYRVTYWVFGILLVLGMVMNWRENWHESIAGAVFLLTILGKAIFRDLRILYQRRVGVRNAA